MRNGYSLLAGKLVYIKKKVMVFPLGKLVYGKEKKNY